ncbi:IscS subfamily cysteine desulfurase [Neobacillus citreus]|uniref:IscS subfamily cysteine desulfurase n=1 Tax=Neobacillus citreus TaxID=2833578 RepID=A0A942T4E0_9BACI|nr:IscS subfamily cysteine desulfurase [Neobacillus citreus]MCH6266716.1 IscS subfamily cysteine desulfurase [Neobacillus citreus]
MKYFDYAATTPLDPEAAEIFVKASTEFFGNSSSLHDIGGQSAALLEHCREEMAQLLGVDKQGLFFTSGGSEGNFLAIEALLSAPKKPGKHIIAGMAEHSSVHGILKRLEKDGYSITYLPFNSSGVIDPGNLLNAIKHDTILVAIQHVNSEIGTIQPIEQLAKICTGHEIHFHTDMVQSFGKIDVRNITSLVSSFSFSGHKIYGPKGIGGAYVNPKIGWSPFFPGTSHEKGFRPGTLNVPAIAAMTTAAQKITGRIQENARRFVELRHAFLNALQPISERVHVYQAEGDSQLPNIIGMRITRIEGQWMMLECNRLGFAISTGSACQIGMQTPAKVTQALGLTIDESKEFIRISFGHPTTMNEVEGLGAGILKIANEFAVSSVI